MAEKRVINSDSTAREVLHEIADMYREHRYLRITIMPGVKRSLDQNSMNFELYTHIANQLYGGDLDLARAECKLDIGMPILRQDDEEFNELCARTIDFLSREKQLDFIRRMSVTSDMTRQQNSKFIEAVLDHYTEAGVGWPEYLLKSAKWKPKWQRKQEQAQRRVA